MSHRLQVNTWVLFDLVSYVSMDSESALLEIRNEIGGGVYGCHNILINSVAREMRILQIG